MKLKLFFNHPRIFFFKFLLTTNQILNKTIQKRRYTSPYLVKVFNPQIPSDYVQRCMSNKGRNSSVKASCLKNKTTSEPNVGAEVTTTYFSCRAISPPSTDCHSLSLQVFVFKKILFLSSEEGELYSG